jgi:hypothetical protein
VDGTPKLTTRLHLVPVLGMKGAIQCVDKVSSVFQDNTVLKQTELHTHLAWLIVKLSEFLTDLSTAQCGHPW